MSWWTTEREKLAICLWGQGLSASQVARQIGAKSRNAVIAKLHRLGASHRVSPRYNDGSHRAKAPRSRVKAKKPFTFSMAPNRKRTKPVEITDLAPEPEGAFESHYVPLLDLPAKIEDACRFPNPAATLFCAHPRKQGRRACRHHLRGMYGKSAGCC